jgi:transglutaminase-like putative cysteine protease
MDFHAVAEAYFDGAWYVIDGTRLANRHSLVRIATGRDAADCAFLSYHGGYVGLKQMRVDAWVMPDAASADGLEGDGRPDALERALNEGDAASDPAADDFTTLIQLA